MNVSLYHPENWIQAGHWHYLNHTPGKLGKWQNISYTINDKTLKDVDFVVVHDDIDQSLDIKALEGNFVLVTSEEKSAKQYVQQFLDQFDLIITTRDDIQHRHVIRTHYLHPWSIKNSYDEIVIANPVKQRSLSAIISNVTLLPGHKERFAFINKLKGHYKNDLDWFSKGENTYIENKWDGLAPYKFSIAIENSRHFNYFTEKVTDCFLTETVPIYSGCVNMNDFFDDRSFLPINTNDFMDAIDKIDAAIDENFYAKMLPFVRESKRLVLEKYHFLAALTNILNEQKKSTVKKRKLIRPQVFFLDNNVKSLLKKSVKKIINW